MDAKVSTSTAEPARAGFWVRVFRQTKPRPIRRFLQTIHLWVGIILALPMILIGLSGSILLVQREILFLSVPAASATGEQQPLARVIEAAQASVAPDLRANAIELPRAAGRPAAVQFPLGGRRNLAVLVDPVSLKVLGSSEVVRRGPIMTFFTDIHEFLMMPGHIGLPAVGWTAVAMTFMAVSGLILWWPKKGFWRSAFLVRRGARGLRLHLDLHHAVGAWGMILFLILSVSGIYLAFPQAVSTSLRTFLPSGLPTRERVFDPVAREWPMGPDRAVAIARSVIPEARVTALQLPVRGATPMVVQMETTGLWPSIPPITVTFHPDNPDFIGIDDPSLYSLADRVLNVGYALHFSLGMGYLWTFIVFLGGLLPLFLAVTGVTIWWMKPKAR